jgi:hypothetical protein
MIIECDVTEIKEPRVNVMVRVPPSDELFFLAHKVVLAMRLAGVRFDDAQFYRPMRGEDEPLRSCGGHATCCSLFFG